MSTNLFAQFRRLIPTSPVLVGLVVSSGSGQVLVELPGGSRVTIRGDATVGSHVSMRSGAVEGVAPSLPAGTIEV